MAAWHNKAYRWEGCACTEQEDASGAAPGHPGTVKCEELFSKFEQSLEAAYIKLASDRLAEN